MARTFKKRGLRRDLDFADIPTPETALNNMLGGIAAQGQVGDQFISQDLDVIRDLRSTTMVRGDFLNIDNAAPKGLDPENPEEPYFPIITLQNRFDQARFTIGQPQFFGGDGLTSRYFEPSDINHATATNVPASLTGVMDNADAIDIQREDGTIDDFEIFWEQGQFEFLGKIKPDLDSVFGGVQYSGWFKPTRGGRWTFSSSTTGLFTFEFNTGANAVSGPGSVTKARLRPIESINLNFVNGSSTVTVNGSSGTRQGLDVMDTILEGDILWTTGQAQLSDADNLVTVLDNVNKTNRTFEMSTSWTGSSVSNVTVYLVHPFGESGSWREATGNLSEYEYYPITIRYIWKDTTYSFLSQVSALNIDNSGEYYFTADSGLINSLSVNVTPPNSSGTYLNYRYLYNENYERNPTGLDRGDFYAYYENRVPPGGTRIFVNYDGSIGSASDADEYENVFTKGQLVIPYEPPKNFNEVLYSKSLGYNIGSVILTTGNTDGIEVGNFVVASTNGALSTTAVVTAIEINQAIFLNEAISDQGQGDGSETFYFIDHRGLKRIDSSVTFSSGSATISNFTPTGVEVGDVIITSGTTGTGAWNVINTIGGSSIVGSLNQTANSSAGINGHLFIYERSGLKNDSLDTYCNGVHGATTVGTASSGSSTITITNPTVYDGIPGAANPSAFDGDFVFFGDRIPPNTTASVSGSGPWTVTLSNTIDDDIPADQVLVFVSSNINKDLCFPPTDTSPPFTATQNGLQTTSGRPTIEVTGADGEVKFVRLFINNGTVQTATAQDSFDRKISIKDLNGDSYSILSLAV